MKRKSFLRTGLGVGLQIASFFLLEVVVVFIKTIGESIHNPSKNHLSNDEIERRRSEIWKAYKQGRPVDFE